MNKNLNKTPEFQKLYNHTQSVAQQLGLILYDIEFSNGPQGPVLRIFIDKEVEGGVGVDDCANISRDLNDYLDKYDPIPQSNYSLEVSSPGVDRHLTQIWHFEKVIGKKVSIKVNDVLAKFGCEDSRYVNSKSILDQVLSVEGDIVTVKVGESQVKLTLAVMDKAKLAFEYEDKESTLNSNKTKGKSSKKSKK